MKFKNQFFLLSLFTALACANPHANEVLPKKSIVDKVLSYISESKLMYAINKYAMRPINNRLHKIIPIGNEDASQNFKELGQRAQQEVGINQDRILPIKKVMASSLYAMMGAAFAEPDAIYVNEDKLNQRSYGAQRCGLLHEAVHTKYNDSASDAFFELCSFLAFSYGAHSLIKAIKPQGKYKILHALSVLVAGMTGTSLTSINYHHFMERRADIEGHYASQCFHCVEEAAEQRRIVFEVEKNPLQGNGYLSADELKKIAHELKLQNKVCEHHTKQL